LRRTFSDIVRGATDRKNILALIDQAVVSVANFLTGLIIGRICTKEQFGLYALGFTVITMGICVQDSLILTPYTIYSPRLKGAELSQYKASTFFHQFLYSLCVLFLLILFLAGLSLGAGPPGMAPVIEALIFVTAFILLRNYARRVSFAALDMGEALALDCVVSILQIFGLAALSYFDSLAAAGAYWIVGAACGVGAIPWVISKRSDLRIQYGKAMTDLKRNFSTGKWILGSGLLWTMVISAHPWLLATFHGTASTGVWAACIGVINICNPVFLAMQNSFSPKIAHAYANAEGNVFQSFSLQVTRVFGLVLAPFCIVLVFFGERLVTWMYGGKYAGTGFIVSILALDFLVSAQTFPLSRALFTVGRADVDFKINLVMLLCLFSFSIPLVMRFGPVGAAAGLLLTDSTCLACRYIALSRLLPVSVEKPALESKTYPPSLPETK